MFPKSAEKVPKKVPNYNEINNDERIYDNIIILLFFKMYVSKDVSKWKHKKCRFSDSTFVTILKP